MAISYRVKNYGINNIIDTFPAHVSFFYYDYSYDACIK